MILGYIFTIWLFLAVNSIDSGDFCLKQFIGGKWTSQGNCELLQDIGIVMNDLRQKLQIHPITITPTTTPFSTTAAFEKPNNASLKAEITPMASPTTTTTSAITAEGCGDIVYDVNELRNDTGDIFQIHPSSVGLSPVLVYCDVKTDGGGWLVFQRRMDGSEDFYRGWDDYVNGFGDKRREFWLGLEKLYRLTQNSNQELRIDVITTSGNHYYANYRNFTIRSSSDFYRLEVNGYSGNYSDQLRDHNNKQFTTKDVDRDDWKDGNCAINRKGAWWYYWCASSNLNAKFNTKYLRWGQVVRFSEMKIRQRR